MLPKNIFTNFVLVYVSKHFIWTKFVNNFDINYEIKWMLVSHLVLIRGNYANYKLLFQQNK